MYRLFPVSVVPHVWSACRGQKKVSGLLKQIQTVVIHIVVLGIEHRFSGRAIVLITAESSLLLMQFFIVLF